MSATAAGDTIATIERRLSERLREKAMAAGMTARCHLCPDWSYTGAAGDAIAAHLEHRREAHPELRVQARKRGSAQGGPSLKLVKHNELADDERAELEAERLRRAKAHGIEAELSPW